MKKRIILLTETQQEIARGFGVTDRMVRKALSYASNTEVARRIRKIAIEKGGEVVGAEKLETIYPVDRIVQTYGGRLRIETDTTNGLTTVYIDGEEVERASHLKISEYICLQQRYIRKIDVQ